MTMGPPLDARLLRLLAPTSVAVIGASNDASRIGGRPLARLIETGFAGPLYPVNPGRDTVQGLRAVRSAAELPEGIDAAVVAVPAPEAVQAVRDCAARGVGGVVLFSSGFAETGADGAALQQQLAELRRHSGIRIVGPNCMGFFNVARKAYLGFNAWTPTALAPHFNVAILSQSGGYGSHVLRLCQRRGLGISHWITTGNECDVEAGELMGVLAHDPDVNAVFVYIEGIRSRDSLLAALRAARSRRVPIVLVKCGRTEIASLAAASHTAALTGADAVYDAVLREYGVHRADSTEEALDVLYALSRKRLPPHPRTVVFSLSGGVGVQIADYMGDNDLALPELSAPAQDAIKQLAPQAATRNPVDITAQFMNDTGLVRSCLETVLGTDRFDVVVSFLSTVGLLPEIAAPVIEAYADAMRRHPDGLNLVITIALPEIAAGFEEAGCLVFEEPKRAIRALAALRHFARAFADPAHVSSDELAPAGQDLPRIEPGRRFDEVQAKALLRSCGLRTLQERVVKDRPNLAEGLEGITFPVALKVISADILHKSDAGGVRLDIADVASLASAIDAMASAVARHAPAARIDGFLVSPMLSGGVECVIGVTHDPAFGPVVMFGLGGILLELLQDVSFRVAPVARRQALAMIRDVRGTRLLDGYRGQPAADVDALADAIVLVSRIAAANAGVLKTLELNPVRVLPPGQGLVALDAVIETLPV